MAWIESHQSLSRHRKTLRAAKLLRCDRHKLIGHLHELWWWALDNAEPDGRLPGITPGELAEAAGYTKEGFTDALIEAGFVEVVDSELTLHDWYDYAGKLNDRRAVTRQSNRERQQRRRDKQRDTTPPVTRDRHADVTRDRRDENVTVTTLPNQPNQPNQPAAVAASAAAAAEEPAGRIFRAWEAATGTTVTRQTGERIDHWLEALPEAAVLKAIVETGNNGAKRWSYTEAILERFQRDGWEVDSKPAQSSAAPAGPYRTPLRVPPPVTRETIMASGRTAEEADEILSRMKTGGPR